MSLLTNYIYQYSRSIKYGISKENYSSDFYLNDASMNALIATDPDIIGVADAKYFRSLFNTPEKLHNFIRLTNPNRVLITTNMYDGSGAYAGNMDGASVHVKLSSETDPDAYRLDDWGDNSGTMFKELVYRHVNGSILNSQDILQGDIPTETSYKHRVAVATDGTYPDSFILFQMKSSASVSGDPHVVTVSGNKYDLPNDTNCYSYLKHKDFKLNIKLFRNRSPNSYIRYIYFENDIDKVLIELYTLKMYEVNEKTLEAMNNNKLLKLQGCEYKGDLDLDCSNEKIVLKSTY